MRKLMLWSAANLAALVTAGCTPEGPVASRAPSDGAQITGIAVRAERLVVEMSDGARCVADRPRPPPYV